MKLNYLDYQIKKTIRGDWLFLVNFEDEDTKTRHNWAPKWKQQMDKIYYACYLVESLNGGRNLEGFVENAQKIAKSFESEPVPLSNAEVIEGLLVRIENNKLVIQQKVKRRKGSPFDFSSIWGQDKPPEFYEDIIERQFLTSFELSEEWAFMNLFRQARCLVIKEVITRVEIMS